jgi:DNA-binding transcriptional MerR regulator
LYSVRDLELIRLIRRLVDEDGMSLQGVGAWLEAHADVSVEPRPDAISKEVAGLPGGAGASVEIRALAKQAKTG